LKNGGPADRRVPFGSHNQRNHSTGSSRYGPEPKHFAAKHQPLNQADDNYLIPRCNMSSSDITPLSGSAVTAVLSDRGIPYTEVVSLSPGECGVKLTKVNLFATASQFFQGPTKTHSIWVVHRRTTTACRMEVAMLPSSDSTTIPLGTGHQRLWILENEMATATPWITGSTWRSQPPPTVYTLMK